MNTPIAISRQLSSKIAGFGFLAACLVVFIHVEPKCSPGSMAYWWYRSLGGGLSTIAVPFFFCVSGFLLAGHFNESGWYGTAIRKRLGSLLIPYLACSFLYFFYISCTSYISNIVAGRPFLDNIDLSVRRFAVLFGLDPLLRPEYGVLWYVRNLFFLIISAPLLAKVANLWGCLVLFLLYCTVCPVTSVVDGTWKIVFRFFFSLEGCFYFTLGIFLRSWDCNIAILRSRLLAGISFVVGMLLMIGTTGGKVKCVAIMFVLYAAWTLFPTLYIAKRLTSCAFPIYLIHGFVTFLCGRIISNFSSLLFLKETWYGYLILTMTVISISIATCYVMRKVVPSFANILFGGR